MSSQGEAIDHQGTRALVKPIKQDIALAFGLNSLILDVTYYQTAQHV